MGSQKGNLSLSDLRSTGCNFIAVVVTEYVQSVSSTDIFPLYSGESDQECGYYQFVTVTIDEARKAIQKAHALGMQVLLKPHIDIIENHAIPCGGAQKCCGAYWRGDIGANFTATEWSKFFVSYQKMFQKYQQLAAEEQVAMLSLNCELVEANKQTQFWISLALKTRLIYSGKLTIAANWYPYPQTLPDALWNAVDVIGVDAYYTSINGTTPTQISQDWQESILPDLKNLSMRLNQKVNSSVSLFLFCFLIL
jgi:hypothetical protein